jgi:hypothetical protein
VRIVRYSDLLVAVFGDTAPVEHVLKELHGEPASHLTLGGLLARGWLFHVQTLIDRGVDLGFLLRQHPEVHVEDDLGPLGAVVGPGRGRPLVTRDGYSPQVCVCVCGGTTTTQCCCCCAACRSRLHAECVRGKDCVSLLRDETAAQTYLVLPLVLMATELTNTCRLVFILNGPLPCFGGVQKGRAQ